MISEIPTRLLIFSDVHCPNHNEEAWRLMLSVARAWRPQEIICNGDFLDNDCLSAHPGRNPNRTHFLEQEYEQARKMLDQLDSLGAKKKVFIFGNHEDRLRRWLADHASPLYNDYNIEQRLTLHKRNWVVVPYKDLYDSGKVIYTHDLEDSGSTALRQALSKAQHSIVIGHTHRFGSLVQSDIRGRSRIATSFGWLGDVDKVDYRHRLLARTEWALGFALGERWPDQITTFQPLPIISGTVRALGRIFR